MSKKHKTSFTKEELEKKEKEDRLLELKTKEEELENRKRTRTVNEETLKTLNSQFELMNEEFDLQKEEINILSDNPYAAEDRSEEWTIHIKSLMEFKFKKIEAQESVISFKYNDNHDKMVKQNKRCTKDIPELEVRIKELKKLVDK